MWMTVTILSLECLDRQETFGDEILIRVGYQGIKDTFRFVEDLKVGETETFCVAKDYDWQDGQQPPVITLTEEDWLDYDLLGIHPVLEGAWKATFNAKGAVYAVRYRFERSPRDDIEQLGFDGEVYYRCQEGYEERCYQYATSSLDVDGSMKPAALIYAMGDADVIRAIEYAKARDVAISVRTGGHQYSGASSTSGDNILLDLSEAYTRAEDWVWNEQARELYTSVHHALTEFAERLEALGISVPHGQCSNVGLGGHVQTGGYGQSSRAFGLLADHVKSFRLITADGQVRTVQRGSADKDEQDLFFAVLGGSPGNFGVLTHVTLAMRRDADHPHSRGLKTYYWYSKGTLKALLDVMVEMAQDDDLLGDFDFCITMISYAQNYVSILDETLDERMREEHEDFFRDDPYYVRPAAISVYAQWANADGTKDQLTAAQALFDKIKAAAQPLRAVFDEKAHKTLSELARAWIYPNVREFDWPYVKRAYATDYTDELVAEKWTEWVTDRIHEIQGNIADGCKVVIQIQHFGGKNSKFRLNAASGETSYSWRDSTLVAAMDCFYHPHWPTDTRARAELWQQQNDLEGVLLDHRFSDQERSLLWGSYGEADLHQERARYYDSEQKYDRLWGIKQAVDPDGVFTPNAFCVGGPRLVKRLDPDAPGWGAPGEAAIAELAEMVKATPEEVREALEALPPAARVPRGLRPEEPRIEWDDARLDRERLRRRKEFLEKSGGSGPGDDPGQAG